MIGDEVILFWAVGMEVKDYPSYPELVTIICYSTDVVFDSGLSWVGPAE